MRMTPTPDYDPLVGRRVFNEAAFRDFLSADLARAERLRRYLFLILTSIRQESIEPMALPTPVAVSLFRGLNSTVREMDFVGWFREGRVPAAVLIQGPTLPHESAGASIAARVRHAVAQQLPAGLVGALRIRVHRLGDSFLN